MKYVKLFESWMNEAEDGEAKTTKFNKTKPRSWPVSKTKIYDLYQSQGPDKEILKSILGRAKQESDKEFNKSSTISLRFLGTLSTRDGKFEYNDNQSNISNVASQASTEFGANGLKFSGDFKDDGGRAVAYGLVINGEATSDEGNDYLSKDGRCVLILPNEIDQISIQPSSLVTELPIIALTQTSRKGTFNTKLANVLLFINGGGDTQSFNEKAGSITDTSSNVGGIFKGETEEGLLAYAKTIKMPSGGNLTVGEDNSNGLYKIGTGNIAKYLGQIKFDFDSDKLTDEAKQILDDDAVSGALAKAQKTLIIVGHADGKVGKGGESYNVDLSKRRAKSVLAYLQTLPWFKKVDAKITTNGVGSSQPVSPDNKGQDPVASAINRRVEFLIDVPADTKPDYEAIKKAANLK